MTARFHQNNKEICGTQCPHIEVLFLKLKTRTPMTKLNPPQTAPKNMDVFLALFEGYPYLVSTTWNPHDQCWVYAQMKCNMMNGEYTDPYFETEYTRETAIIGWLPMPEFEQ